MPGQAGIRNPDDGSEHRHATDPRSDAGDPGAGQSGPMVGSGSVRERCAQALDPVFGICDADLSRLNGREQLRAIKAEN